MWIIKSPKRKKIRRAVTTAAILAAVQTYLDDNSGEAADFLVQFWKDQAALLTLTAIKEFVRKGVIPDEFAQQIEHDYAVLVLDRIVPLWQSALTAGAKANPTVSAVANHFVFNQTGDNVIEWVKANTARLVTNSTDQQMRAIELLISRHLEGYASSVDETANLIRWCIGLTEQQAKANMRYYENIKKQLVEEFPKMNKSEIEKKAQRAAKKYAARQLQERGKTIAETELAYAYHHGGYEAVVQAQDQGLIGPMEKVWTTSGGPNVCSKCKALDGKRIALADSFDFDGKAELFPGQHLTPPLHPRCACGLRYVNAKI